MGRAPSASPPPVSPQPSMVPGAPMPPMHPSRPKRPCRGRERPFVEPKKPRGGRGGMVGAVGHGMVSQGPSQLGMTGMLASTATGVGRGRRKKDMSGEAALVASAEATLTPSDSSDLSVFAVPSHRSVPSPATSPSKSVTSDPEVEEVAVVELDDKPQVGAMGPGFGRGSGRKGRGTAAAARAARAARAQAQAQAQAAMRAMQRGVRPDKKDEEPEITIVEDSSDESKMISATPPCSRDGQPSTPSSCFFSPVASSSPLTVFGKATSAPARGADHKEGELEDGHASGMAANASPSVPVVVLDEETRMSADISAMDGDTDAGGEGMETDSRPTTPPARSLLAPSDDPLPPPARGDTSAMDGESLQENEVAGQVAVTGSVAAPTTGAAPGGEESQGSGVSSATIDSAPGVRRSKCRMEVCDPDAKEFTVDMLAEYQWPPGRVGDPLMLQEQVAEYLGVKSFKRKYPDVQRRPVEAEEKTFLREKGLVSDNLSDMGLTAISSVEVLDIMFADFPEKYEEYRKHLRERQAKEMSLKQKLTSNAERSRLDYRERATSSAASWNAKFNRARRESRRACFDLQNLTVHFPATRVKKMTQEVPKLGNYPIALIPGQFTDFYKAYTPAELRYFPLNTVLYGPMKPNERQEPGGGSDGSQSESEDSSSSDESSSDSSSDGTQDTEDTGSTAGDTEAAEGGPGSAGSGPGTNKNEGGTASAKDGSQNTAQINGRLGNGGAEKIISKEEVAICKVCGGDRNRNKEGSLEVLIHCATCTSSCHPSCLDLTLDMVPYIKKYDWQCTDCKICIQCKDPADEDKMLFCDMCDRGYHIYCVGLRRVPSGRWHCRECAVCASCGAREPGPGPDAAWQHEYKKADGKGPHPNISPATPPSATNPNARVYAQTLCITCSKLWRRGRYCQLCWRCFDAKTDEDNNLITCSVCDKMMHPDCCNAVGGVELDRANFLCEICQEKGHQARPSSLKLTMRPVVKV